MKLLLWPFAAIFGFLSELRARAFRFKILSSTKVGKPVISVGNISTGGTGKSPVVMSLVEELRRKNIKVGIVSRGYGGAYEGLVEVDLETNWTVFGDEPVMMKRRFRDVPIFLCRDRVRAAKELIEKHEVDLILADDGFQHRYLKRDLDVVLLDVTEPPAHYKFLPLGRLRESFAALSRADWVIFTKTNLLKTNQQRHFLSLFFQSKIKPPVSGFCAELEASGFADADGKSFDVSTLPQLYLLSGIGRPHSFTEMVVSLTGRKVEKHWIFADHHPFSESDLIRVFSSYGPEAKIITTEKDFVRLSGLTNFRSRFIILKVDMRLQDHVRDGDLNLPVKGSTDEFWTQIISLVR